ncbi:MAG TPA: hypothetical protein VFT55_12180 [Planctomycetota bacterium]|nr:hypothetical protein [Planctomycetota bacterium]
MPNGILTLLAIAASVAAFVVWRWTSVPRGARKRNRELFARLEPLGARLDAGEVVTPAEVAALAARPEIRHMLFAILRGMDRTDLLPASHRSSVDQGASALAYWLMHPNELHGAPEAIELVETVMRTVDGREAPFHVYRYRMAAGHWAGNEWLLGFVGPMAPDIEAYSVLPSAFSRAGDREGSIRPAELVDWYVDLLRQKGLVQ